MTALSPVPARRRSLLPAQAAVKSPGPPASILGSRSRSAGDGTDSDGASTPSKKKQKKKVAFDMDLNMVKDLGSKSLEEAKREVRKALTAFARGDEEGYDYLKEIFANDRKRYRNPSGPEDEEAVRPEELLIYVVAMTSYAQLLNRSCSGLIKTILNSAWLGRDKLFVSAYIQFLAALSSAHGPCLAQVLSMMLDKFSLAKPSEWTVPDFPKITKETMRERLHLGLQYLLGIFPAARPIICSLIVSKYPYHEQPKSVHMAYIDNLLRLQKYAPDLERDIMELITNQMVKIDVQMQLDLDDASDATARIVSERVQERLSQEALNDEEDEDSDADSVHSEDSDFDEDEHRVRSAEANISKLDAMLGVLFDYYSPYFYDPDSAEALDCFSRLLADFINIILPTTKTRHSQFLLFHFGQKSPQLIDAFLGTLVTISEDSARPLVLRRAAVAYLASFVARGSRLPAELVQEIARTIWHKMDAFRAANEHVCRGPDLRRFAMYYEWAQGLMYLFCFRWRELVQAAPPSVDPDDPASYLDKDLVWVDDLRDAVRRNIRSKLNPLKVCDPTIVEQFAKLAYHLGLDYVFPVLDANKSLHLSQSLSATYSNGGALRETGYDLDDTKWTHLEVNSQFDPYQLPLSKIWVEDDYLQWTGLPGLEREDDDDDDEEEDDDDEGEEGDHDSDDDIGMVGNGHTWDDDTATDGET